jgi:transposase
MEAWAIQAETCSVSELHGFSKGLRKDWAAGTAGLTVPHSSSAVDNQVHRIRMIKKTAVRRGETGLLHKRVLPAD